METADKIKYWNWCADKYWQYQRRQEWTYGWHGDVLVRYHELTMPDPEFTAGLIDWLKSPESVHGFADGEKTYSGCTVYNRPAGLGEEWKPVSAWYEQQEGQVDDRTKLKVIRVYQALQRNPQGGEDGPFVMENGCMQKVTFTYHWKVAELPAVPQGESGVTYRLGGVSKDDETGMWTCYLERRERVMQELTEYTSDNTDFVSRTEKQFLGVRKADVAGTGRAASAAAGVIVRRRVKKNEDCTSDVINETEVAKPVREASVTVERTLRAETTVTEDRNMSSPLDESGLEVGTRVRNEKTEAGLYNRQKTVVKPVTPSGPIKEVCGKTLFEHTHGVTEASASRPAKVDVGNVQLGDGETQEISVRHLDDGTFEKESVVRTEIKVEKAVVETQKTLRGVRKVTINRSMNARASESGMKIGDRVRSELTPGGKYNQTIETIEKTPIGVIAESKQESALKRVSRVTQNVAEKPESDIKQEDGKVKSREVRVTEEGTYDVTDVEDTAKQSDSTVKTGSVLVEETRTEHQNKSKIEIPAPGVNVEVSAQVRKNEYGLEDGTVVKRVHKENSAKANCGSRLRKTEIEVSKNVAAVPVETPGVNEEIDVDISINDHGSLNVRKRKVKHEELDGEVTVESELMSETRIEKENVLSREAHETGGPGKIVTTSSTQNKHGSYKTSKTVRTAKSKSQDITWTTEDDNYIYTHKLQVYRNQNMVPTPPSNQYRCTVSLSINEYGLFDVIINSETREAKGGGGDEGGSASGTMTRYLSYQNKDGELCQRPVTANYSLRTSKEGTLNPTIMSGAESGYGFKSSFTKSLSIIYSNIKVGSEVKIDG